MKLPLTLGNSRDNLRTAIVVGKNAITRKSVYVAPICSQQGEEDNPELDMDASMDWIGLDWVECWKNLDGLDWIGLRRIVM